MGAGPGLCRPSPRTLGAGVVERHHHVSQEANIAKLEALGPQRPNLGHKRCGVGLRAGELA